MEPYEIPLWTRESLKRDFERLGVKQGDIVLLISSRLSIGMVCGGAEAVVRALLDNLGETGTLVVPTFTLFNSEPDWWIGDPVPASWIQTVREFTPPFNWQTTPSTGMGPLAELVRTWPGAIRSAHPQTSFAAVGPAARGLLTEHRLNCRLGEDSPLGRMEAAGARVLLLGVGFESCLAFHLAEYRLPTPIEHVSFAMRGNYGREWVTGSG